MCIWNVVRRHYKRRYSQPGRQPQQTIQRSMIADKTATVTPKLIRVGGGVVYTADDANDYARGEGVCAVHRPLPSLPRHMEGSWAKSVRSDASGSDASLHWDTPDDDTTGVDVGDLPPPATHSRAVRCRSVAAGPSDYGSAGRGDYDSGERSVPGCRTMPRPGVQHGAQVGDAVDQRHLLGAQQVRRQSRPTDGVDVRQYVNIASHSVDVWHLSLASSTVTVYEFGIIGSHRRWYRVGGCGRLSVNGSTNKCFHFQLWSAMGFVAVCSGPVLKQDGSGLCDSLIRSFSVADPGLLSQDMPCPHGTSQNFYTPALELLDWSYWSH